MTAFCDESSGALMHSKLKAVTKNARPKTYRFSGMQLFIIYLFTLVIDEQKAEGADKRSEAKVKINRRMKKEVRVKH